MHEPVSLPAEVWKRLPPEAKAYIQALRAQLQQLQQRVAELEDCVGRNSTNSSQPPSSDPPHVKRRPPGSPSGRRRGGQPGHTRRQRHLVPPDQVQQLIDCRPIACRRCGRPLQGHDPRPLRHQVAELPPVHPTVTEYRLHRLTCPRCSARTCAALPEGVPVGAFGPRLQAVLALLAGGYRLGKRPICLLAQDLFGLSVSPGMVVKLERATAAALERPVAEAREQLRHLPANIDETSWRQGKRRGWLWVAVTACVTVFLIR